MARPGRFDERRGPIGHYLRMCARSRALDIWREAQVADRANERISVLLEAEEGPSTRARRWPPSARRGRWWCGAR